MRIVESLSGIGNVLQDGEKIKTVEYDIQIFEDIVDGEAGFTQVMGNINPADALSLFGQESLRLIVEDGRSIEFFVTSSSGEIRCSGSFVNSN